MGKFVVGQCVKSTVSVTLTNYDFNIAKVREFPAGTELIIIGEVSGMNYSSYVVCYKGKNRQFAGLIGKLYVEDLCQSL